ncbi:exopolygalacturonase [Eucalyptus grandis]|uniref:exopolygalacturonase n=1 Tax=Eucalyptus grandis TaxID=71139 RepID=UPI00192EC0DA|nr:exopolygalacturonase [Eucalyptus grandis]
MAIKSYIGALLLLLLSFSSTINAQVFQVENYSAKGGGIPDITQSLLGAWKKACASTTRAKVFIAGGTFALSEVVLEGPCKAHVEFEIRGRLQAPADPSRFKTDGWVVFQRIDGLTVSGGGTFDGQGKIAWGQNDCDKNTNCRTLPTNLRFNFVSNAIIHNVTTLDSKNFHVNVLGAKNLTFKNFHVNAPGDSVNTDGIHIGRSLGVNILHTNIKTGDDCVSLGDGSRQITVRGVTCGPGHGISVGSLGKYDNEEPVSGVFVTNCTITGATNGARIKTWLASKIGIATDMHFQDVQMNDVANPVLIDQGYCPFNQCQAQIPSLVKISNVSFKRIRGTSSTKVAVKIACSKRIPCEGVEIADINLVYKGPDGPATSECSNVRPLISGMQNPLACAEIVKISDVSFRDIRGTSATPLAEKLGCGRGVPCQKLELADINLRYNGRNGASTSQPANMKPTITGKSSLPICAGS